MLTTISSLHSQVEPPAAAASDSNIIRFNIDASSPFCESHMFHVTQCMHALCSMPFVMLWRYNKCSSYALQLDAETVIKLHTSRSALHAEPHYWLNIHLVRSIVPSLGHLWCWLQALQNTTEPQPMRSTYFTTSRARSDWHLQRQTRRMMVFKDK